jgi:hypothetical protein
MEAWIQNKGKALAAPRATLEIKSPDSTFKEGLEDLK